jgi:hypothetical protein
MGWRDISVNFQRLSQKLAALAPTPNLSRLREGNVLDLANFPHSGPVHPSLGGCVLPQRG